MAYVPKIGDKVFITSGRYRGHLAEVMRVDKNTNLCDVKIIDDGVDTYVSNLDFYDDIRKK